VKRISAILDVIVKQILGRGTIKNQLSTAVVCLMMRMEKAIMLEGILLLNAFLKFLHVHLTVILQALLKLLEAAVFELG
jgi:hypothetical protein